MKTLIALIILTTPIFFGCNAAAMNGFQRGLAGYPPAPVQQPVFRPVVQPNTTSYTYGTIYAPSGPIQYNSTTY